jgi:hypothetical protein
MNLKTFYLPITVISMAFVVNSCRNNSIYFDLSKQTINTCDGTPLTLLFFATRDDQEYGNYYKLDGKQGTANLSIRLKNPEYEFDSGSSNKIFSFDSNGDFFIKNRSNGDAASSQIEVKTDSNGKVIFASKTGCD